MRYAIARYNQHQRDLAYRIYLSECARMTTLNTANFTGGSYIEKKFMDILNPQPEDNRTAEEIVADVFEKMGIEVK